MIWHIGRKQKSRDGERKRGERRTQTVGTCFFFFHFLEGLGVGPPFLAPPARALFLTGSSSSSSSSEDDSSEAAAAAAAAEERLFFLLAAAAAAAARGGGGRAPTPLCGTSCVGDSSDAGMRAAGPRAAAAAAAAAPTAGGSGRARGARAPAAALPPPPPPPPPLVPPERLAWCLGIRQSRGSTARFHSSKSAGE